MGKQGPRIAVIGGSLTGPTAEVMLRSAGFADVTTYEASRISRPTSGGVMGIRPDAVGLLRGVGVEIESALRHPDVVSFDLVGGNNPPALRKRDRFPGITVTWDALHNPLLNRAKIQNGRRVVGIDTVEDEAVLTFANGDEVGADAVLFADGRNSTGRKLLDPTRTLAYQGYMVWRGLIDPPKDYPLRGFHRYYDNPNGALFSLTEPITHGDYAGQSYWEFSHNLAAGAYQAMTGFAPEARSFLLPQNVKRVARTMLSAFATAYLPDAFVDLINRTVEVMGIPVNDTVTPRRVAYRFGKSVGILLGDALATVRLQAGAGLNNGLREAEQVTRILSTVDRPDWYSALRSWQCSTLDTITPWVELGRVRAERTHLGVYRPVVDGQTVPALAPDGDAWETPMWIPATV